MRQRSSGELRLFSVSQYLLSGLLLAAADWLFFGLLLPYLPGSIAAAVSSGLSGVLSARRAPSRPPRRLLLTVTSVTLSATVSWWLLTLPLPPSPLWIKALSIILVALIRHRLAILIYRRWGRPRPTSSVRHLSVVIPAYNEAERLPLTIAQTVTYLKSQPLGWQIIVVNDGSRDDTATTVTRLALKERRIKLLSLLKNRGKGGAIQAGVQAVHETDGAILIMDADNSTPASELDKALPALQQNASVAIGTRYGFESTIIKRQPWPRRAVSRGGNLLIQLFFLPGLKDTQCGFKCFLSEAAHDIFATQTRPGFSFDVEALLTAKIRGYQIAEVPVRWENDPRTTLRPLPDSWQFLRDLLIIKLNLWSGRYF